MDSPLASTRTGTFFPYGGIVPDDIDDILTTFCKSSIAMRRSILGSIPQICGALVYCRGYINILFFPSLQRDGQNSIVSVRGNPHNFNVCQIGADNLLSDVPIFVAIDENEEFEGKDMVNWGVSVHRALAGHNSRDEVQTDVQFPVFASWDLDGNTALDASLIYLPRVLPVFEGQEVLEGHSLQQDVMDNIKGLGSVYRHWYTAAKHDMYASATYTNIPALLPDPTAMPPTVSTFSIDGCLSLVEDPMIMESMLNKIESIRLANVHRHD